MEIPIDKLLSDYTIKAPERTVCKEVSKVIKDVTDVKISVDNISYQHGRLHVDTTPMHRLQIHTNKKDILDTLSDRLDVYKVTDVR